MSLRLEILQARMREENARAAAKAAEKAVKPPKIAKPKVVKLKVAKAKIERPMPMVEESPKPPCPLTDVVTSLTKDEIASTKNIIMMYSFAIFDELIRCGSTSLSALSDGELSDMAYVTAQAYEEKPNLQRVVNTALCVVDSIEVRLGTSEGDAIRRLRALEKTLLAHKLKLEGK